jgi:hypothetical protein
MPDASRQKPEPLARRARSNSIRAVDKLRDNGRISAMGKPRFSTIKVSPLTTSSRTLLGLRCSSRVHCDPCRITELPCP